jgi:hypothetical protein
MNTKNIRILASVVVFLILFVGLRVLCVLPGSAVLNGHREKLRQIQTEIKENKRLIENKDKLGKEIKRYTQKNKDYQKAIISPPEFDFFRNTIRDVGVEYDLKVVQDRTSLQSDSKKIAFAKNPNYIEKLTSLRLACKYHNFGGFLNRIENSSPYHQVVSLDMIRTTSPDEEELLEVNLEIVSLLTEIPA